MKLDRIAGNRGAIIDIYNNLNSIGEQLETLSISKQAEFYYAFANETLKLLDFIDNMLKDPQLQTNAELANTVNDLAKRLFSLTKLAVKLGGAVLSLATSDLYLSNGFNYANTLVEEDLKDNKEELRREIVELVETTIVNIASAVTGRSIELTDIKFDLLSNLDQSIMNPYTSENDLEVNLLSIFTVYEEYQDAEVQDTVMQICRILARLIARAKENGVLGRLEKANQIPQEKITQLFQTKVEQETTQIFNPQFFAAVLEEHLRIDHETAEEYTAMHFADMQEAILVGNTALIHKICDKLTIDTRYQNQKSGDPNIKLTLIRTFQSIVLPIEIVNRRQNLLENIAKFQNINLIHNIPTSEEIEDQEATASIVYKLRGQGIIAVHDATSKNGGELPAYNYFIDGKFVRTIADLISIEVFQNEGDIIGTISSLPESIRIPAFVAYQYIFMLGNNYVNHDYTNSNAAKVKELSPSDKLKLYFIEGIGLCQDIFETDIIGISSNQAITADTASISISLESQIVNAIEESNSSRMVLGGGARYTPNGLVSPYIPTEVSEVYAERCVPQEKLQSVYSSLHVLLNSDVEWKSEDILAVDMLIKFAQDYNQMTPKELDLLATYWGIELTNTDGELKSEKELKDLVKIVKESLCSESLELSSPLLRLEGTPIIDPRFRIYNEVMRTQSHTEAELGRYVKLEHMDINQYIPGHQLIAASITNYFSYLYQDNNSRPDANRAFIQARYGLLKVAVMTANWCRSFMETGNTNPRARWQRVTPEGNYALEHPVTFMFPVPIKNGHSTEDIQGMKGYFENLVIDVRSFDLDYMVQQTNLLINNGRSDLLNLILLIEKKLADDVEDKREKAIEIFWLMPRKELIELIEEANREVVTTSFTSETIQQIATTEA